MMVNQDPEVLPPEQNAEAAALRQATAELHVAIDGLTTAKLTASPVEKAEARDRFEIALANYSSHLDSRTA
jgi:hypothetical protein